MSRTTSILSMAVVAAVLSATTTASALTVNWGAPTAINSNLDIINPTGVIRAVNFTANSQPAIINVDVGGTIIPFDSSGVVGGTGFHNDTFFVDNNPAAGTVSGSNTSEFHQVLDGFRDNSTTSFTFTGLNTGETYFVQAFQSDDRGNRNVDWNIDGTQITFASDNSLFRSSFAVAEVILDGGETSFKLERPGGAGLQINAAVLSQALSTQVTPSYTEEVLADSPVVYYRFEESSGETTAVDSSGNGNDGTYINNPTLGNPSGFIGLGNAVELDGVNQRIDMGPLNGGTQLGQSTIEVWVNVDALSPGDCCTSIFSTDTFSNGNLHFNLKPGLDIEHAVAGGSPNNVNTADGAISFDQWAHIVATYDAAGTEEVLIYVNGTLIGSGLHNSGIFANFTAANIGSFGLDRFFNGEIDEFAIYDSILSPERVAAHFRARNSLAADVPEPTTAALGLMGIAGLLMRRRKVA